ncbi:MAG TPA: hypothetical protein VN680_17660, partial [Burkholderiaceae bacterium]|nr:hypothetical protein [Burkholderiaceae bacterium]
LDSGYVNGQEHVLCHSITCVADPSTHYFSDSNPTPTTFDSLPRKVLEHFPEQLLRLFDEVPRSVRADRDLWGMVKDLRYGALDS